MPALSFILPHWVYWLGLLVFPLIAAYLVRRQLAKPPRTRPSLFIAYLFWLTSGFLGIHRFYLRSAVGFAFIPVFLFILYCNAQIREVSDDTSRTFAALEHAQVIAERAKPDSPSPPPEEAAQYETAKGELAKAQGEYETAKAVTDHWRSFARYGAIVLAIMLLADAIVLPRAVRLAGDREAANGVPAPAADSEPDRQSIEQALARAGGIVAQAAAELGLSRQALYRRMERLGIARP